MEAKAKTTSELQFSVFQKEDYNKFFEEIKNIHPSTAPDDILKIIQDKLTLTLMLVKELTPEMMSSLTAYRVRVLKPDEKIIETDINQFSYPPVERAKMSRANRDGQQVFYSSLDPNTPFFESARDIVPGSTIVYHSKWAFKALPTNTWAQSLLFGIDENDNNTASIMASGTASFFNKIFSNIPEIPRDNIAYYHKLYQELFTSKERNYYHITSSIVSRIFFKAFNQTPKVDVPIVMYPSVAKNKEALNFVIRKDFVDSYMYLKEVDKVLVTKMDDEAVIYTAISRGVVENGVLVWHEPDVTPKKIDYENALVGLDDNPKNFRRLLPNEALTVCCKEHKISVKAFFERSKISDNFLYNGIGKLPEQFPDYELKKDFEYMIIAPTKGNVYVDSNISESAKVKFLAVPIFYSVEYVRVQNNLYDLEKRKAKLF